MIHERPEPLLAGPQRLLGLLEGSNIDGATHQANRFALCVAHGHAAREQPAVRAIFVPAPRLDLVIPGLAGQIGSHGALHPLPVIGMHERHPGRKVGWQLGTVVAGLVVETNELPAAVLENAVRHVHFANSDVRASHRQLQAGVGLPQLALQPLALGDVLDNRDAVGGLPRRVALERGGHVRPDNRAIPADEPFLHRESGQFAAHEEFEECEVRLEIIGMHDLLKGLANQFRAGVPEDLAQLLVGAQAAVLAVHVGNADGSVFERTAEPLLTFPQILLGPFEVVDVDDAARRANGPPLGIPEKHALS